MKEAIKASKWVLDNPTECLIFRWLMRQFGVPRIQIESVNSMCGKGT